MWGCLSSLGLIPEDLYKARPHLYMYTEMDSCSVCHMLCSSSLASFIVGAWEKQLCNFVTSSSSEKLLQDNITCLTAPADFLNNSILNPLLLALHAWSTSSIQSLKVCLFVPSKVLIDVNIESFDLSLLTLVNSWKASCCILWLAAIISRDLDGMLANSINVALRSWPGIDPSID